MTQYRFTDEEQALIESMQIPFAVYQFVNKRVVTIALSDGFCALLGYTDRAQAYHDMDRDMYKDTHPDDAGRVADIAFRFAHEDDGIYEAVYRSRKPYGSDYRIIHALGKHVVTPTGERLAHVWYMDEGDYHSEVFAEDENLNRSFNEALHQESIVKASYYDHLTGLPSMSYFFELANQERMRIAQEGGESVTLFLDLSGLKFFNRRHGFAEGDKLLRSFARVLTRYFSNESCSRFGQDHFAVITKADNVEGVLKQLFEDCRTLNSGVSLPVRVGIYPDAMEKVDASTACDRAKLACDEMRDTYVSCYRYFDAAMKESSERRQYIVANLDRAMQENWIHVYYQPIVRAVNGRVCDEEALARWIDPVKGFLSPGDFIPILEDAKLIYKLDLYMLDQVLEKLKIQAEAGLHLVPQSINLSRSDFEYCDIVEEIRKRVDDAGVARSMITIEITESVIGSDFDFMRTQVDRFRELGFPVWMDDFGSGYSSLDVLQSIKFNLIKFDMRFMQTLGEGDGGKIILTELMRMATAMGVDTVCEGVETSDQVRFLREIGCSKLQGYYFAKPMPMEKIWERYQTGTQIGFENPKEAAYYESIGRVNLYDLGAITQEESGFHNYFNTLPMAVLELCDDKIHFVRSNRSYRDYMERNFGFCLIEDGSPFVTENEGIGSAFLKAVNQCALYGNRIFLDEKLPNGAVVHSFLRRLAVNPETGISAIAVAVLSVVSGEQGTTYENIARALTADYFNLFYVDLNTEEFIEYTSGVGEEEIAMERHGKNFFETASRDARRLLCKEDQDSFIAAFTKEQILNALDKKGTFTLTYRLLKDGNPIYASMKIRRMSYDDSHIIIGVSSIDAEMKQKAALDRIRREQITYARILALSDNYICLYTVDPETSRYTQYSAVRDYEELGLAKEGEDFFLNARIDGERTVYAEDVPEYLRQLTREHVMEVVRDKNGIFTMRYRLVIGGQPRPVNLRAALVDEDGVSKLVVGVKMLTEDFPIKTV